MKLEVLSVVDYKGRVRYVIRNTEDRWSEPYHAQGSGLCSYDYWESYLPLARHFKFKQSAIAKARKLEQAASDRQKERAKIDARAEANAKRHLVKVWRKK